MFVVLSRIYAEIDQHILTIGPKQESFRVILWYSSNSNPYLDVYDLFASKTQYYGSYTRTSANILNIQYILK